MNANATWLEVRSNTAASTAVTTTTEDGGDQQGALHRHRHRLDVRARATPSRYSLDTELDRVRALSLNCAEEYGDNGDGNNCLSSPSKSFSSAVGTRLLAKTKKSLPAAASPSSSIATLTTHVPRVQPAAAALVSLQPRRSSFKKKKTLLGNRSEEEGNIRKSVSFSRLEIRSYEQILGEGNAVPADGGAPVSLGWKYDPSATEILSVDEYESIESIEQRRRHCCENGILLLKEERELILLQGGYSWGDIRDTAKDCKRIQQRRRRSYERARREEALTRAVERCKRKSLSLLPLSGSSSREKLVGALRRRGSDTLH